MWLTRDNNGERSLFNHRPYFDGEAYWCCRGFVFLDEDIAKLCKNKCFGVPKGGIAEVDVKLEITKL